MTVIVLLVAGTTDLGSTAEPSAAASWIKLILGVALLLLGVRQWRSRPGPDESAELPKWMSVIDTVTPVKASGLGLLLAAVNPKNLALCLAAGVAIAGAALPTSQEVAAVAIFTLIAACTVAVPVIGYAIAAGRMAEPLKRLKAWLEQQNSAIMGVLLLILGVSLLGKGIGGLL